MLEPSAKGRVDAGSCSVAYGGTSADASRSGIGEVPFAAASAVESISFGRKKVVWKAREPESLGHRSMELDLGTPLLRGTAQSSCAE